MTLRAPLLSPPRRLAGAAAQVLGSSMALLTAVAAAAPFANVDWSAPKLAPSVVSPSLGSPRVLLTTGAPFNQLDWSPAKRPAPIAAPDQLHTNIGRFTNPIPFVSTDRPMVWRVPLVAPPQSLPNNIGLLTNPIPLTRFDGSSVWRVADFLPPDQPYNLALLTGSVAQAPFSKTDWSSTWRAPDFLPPDPRPLNLALLNLNPIPFAQYGWPLTSGVRSSPPQSSTLNVNIFSEVPFSRADWSSTWRVSDFLPPVVQPVNIGLLAPAVALPFSKTDWSSTWQTPDFLPPHPLPLNLALLNLNPIPFAQYGWPSTWRVSGLLPPTQQPANIGLLAPTVTIPFSKVDWSKPRSALAVAPAYAAYNIVLYGVVPAPPFGTPRTGLSVHGALGLAQLPAGAPQPSRTSIDPGVAPTPDGTRRLTVHAAENDDDADGL